jgi:hypothetical protein
MKVEGLVGNVVFDSCGTSIFEEMSRLAMRVDAVNLGQGFPEGLEPKEVIEAAMRALRDGLRRIGFDVGDVGAIYFAVAGAARFDGAGDDAEFCRLLTLQAGVTAVPISAFYGGRDVKSHIRFCFAKKQETLEAALERLARWSSRAGLRAAS